MPTVAEITEPLVRSFITRAVSDVFKTMLGRESAFVSAIAQSVDEHQVHPSISPANGTTPFVVGIVGFLGDVNGLIYLYLDETFARHCTRHLLGMSDQELVEAGDEVINDAIGELTNMTVGSFKNGLCDAGFPCKLTIPSILRGSKFSIEPVSSATRYTYNYESAGQKLIVDILLKTGE